MPDIVNSVNTNSAPSTKLNVGVLPVPDNIAKHELFNDAEATKKFNVLTADIFQSKEKINYEDTTKTPKGLMAFGAVLVATAVAIKTGAYSKIKNIIIKAVK